MAWEGESSGCRNTVECREEKQKLVIYEASKAESKCENGNANYCSGWDNWAWDTLPSAIIIQKGVNGQLGFGGEFGAFREIGYTMNWRSREFDIFYTQGRYAYLGTPQLAGGGYYKGITFVYGASSNESIVGNSNAAGGTISLDSGGTFGATYQQSLAVNETGQRIIDRRSGRPIQGYQFSIGVGGNLLVNAADAGGLLTEENSQIGSPTSPLENIIFQILKFFP
jgi:hypothetical protein